MRVGEHSDDICNRLDLEITVITISSVPWYIDNTLQHFVWVQTGRINCYIIWICCGLTTQNFFQTTNTFSWISCWAHHFFVICSFHRNLASRVIQRYFAVLAYATCLPSMKIGWCLIFLFVKSICTDLDSLRFTCHFLVQIANLFTADCTFLLVFRSLLLAGLPYLLQTWPLCCSM
jgi:hypothetical protein